MAVEAVVVVAVAVRPVDVVVAVPVNVESVKEMAVVLELLVLVEPVV